MNKLVDGRLIPLTDAEISERKVSDAIELDRIESELQEKEAAHEMNEKKMAARKRLKSLDASNLKGIEDIKSAIKDIIESI